MKKMLLLLILLLITNPCLAKYSSKYPLTMTQSSQSGEKTKIYASNGASYQGFVKPISSNRYAVKDEYGRTQQTYKVKNNKIYVDKYVWH